MEELLGKDAKMDTLYRFLANCEIAKAGDSAIIRYSYSSKKDRGFALFITPGIQNSLPPHKVTYYATLQLAVESLGDCLLILDLTLAKNLIKGNLKRAIDIAERHGIDSYVTEIFYDGFWNGKRHVYRSYDIKGLSDDAYIKEINVEEYLKQYKLKLKKKDDKQS